MPINGDFTPFDLERIKKAIAYLEKHFCDNISAENLSLEVKMDIKQLQMGFQKLTGFTVHNYLLKIRIDKASKTLGDFSISIKSIAYEHGFSSPAHFSTEFKKQKGINPLRYRHQLITTNDNSQL